MAWCISLDNPLPMTPIKNLKSWHGGSVEPRIPNAPGAPRATLCPQWLRDAPRATRCTREYLVHQGLPVHPGLPSAPAGYPVHPGLTGAPGATWCTRGYPVHLGLPSAPGATWCTRGYPGHPVHEMRQALILANM